MNVASAGGSVLLTSQAVQANTNAGNPARANNDARLDQSGSVQANQPDGDGDGDDRGRGTNINVKV